MIDKTGLLQTSCTKFVQKKGDMIDRDPMRVCEFLEVLCSTKDLFIRWEVINLTPRKLHSLFTKRNMVSK